MAIKHMFSNNTVVGPSILINGRLSGDENLTVRGRVEGEIALSRTLIVEGSGIVKANVSVRHAIVSGVVVGNITATECVELTPRCRMVGDIASPRVIIVDGASFRGRVEMGDAEALRAARENSEAKPVASPSYASSSSHFSSMSRPPPIPRLLQSNPSVHKPPVPPRIAPVQVSTPSESDVSSADSEDDMAAEKPLPPEPPAFMDENKKKLVVKKKK